jgi:hypothetical protein
MPRCLPLVLAALLALAACKGDRNQCEKACRNFSALVYWEKADKEIAAAPEAERAELKKKKLGKFTMYIEEGIDHCVNQCASANNDEMIDCMISAKTGEQAKACIPKDED